MLIVFIRALILYTIVVITMRIMGKRQIGQLQPFELVIAVLIAELAGIPMSDTDIPLINGVVAILTLLISQVFLSYITLKSNRARKVVCGAPSILIENGKIAEKELRRLRYNINDLIEQLRLKNYANISDVEYAILETDGQLSVIPKSSKRPVITEDLHIAAEYEGLPLSLVIDGRVIDKNLHALGKDREWLVQQVQAMGFGSCKEILFASLDSSGNLFTQRKTGG
ncbi:MAG: hypothetical protein HPY66_0525 [Firmicutes bacterium]|nr:hypothetical protein [Bacillota bacterium]MDI6704921.1 DUF421 domain-containing protein [Bacillota bacterium]